MFNTLKTKNAVVLSLLLLLLSTTACEKVVLETTRNPFDVKDVNDPFGDDVISFYQRIIPFSGVTDANATIWVTTPSGTNNSIYGSWSSRWNGGSAGNDWIAGTSQIEEKNGFVYILFIDQTSSYLTEARFENDSTLIGRYVNLNNSSDSSPWVGIIKSNSRIDGIWERGRWDYQR